MPLIDHERIEALAFFYRGADEAAAYTFWHAPLSGDARRITNRDEINWTSAWIPEKAKP